MDTTIPVYAGGAQSEAVTVKHSDGYLVTLRCGDEYRYEHEDTWDDAIALYDEGTGIYNGWAITPTDRGRPLGSYSPQTIAAMRADR